MTQPQSLHLPVTFASIWPEELPVELIDAGGEIKLAMPGFRQCYSVILHATRADVARLLWPEEETR